MMRMQWKKAGQLALALMLAACSADPTSSVVASPQTVPQTVPQTSIRLPDGGSLGVITTLRPLQRKIPLGSDVRVEATIGSAGGTIRVPQAGFVLTVPAGAVDSETRFAVTALQGFSVAYEFEPHGSTFARPLDAQQDLRVTRQGLLRGPLVAGYFADRSLLTASSGGVLVSEVIQGLHAPRMNRFVWNIEHFSGYIVAW